MALTPQGATALYRDDAKRLRSAMQTNLDDSKFAKDGGRIVYIVDANIVLLFIRPTKNIHHLGPFQRWLEEPVLVTNATLMAEFVFSGRLPGQRDPIYMSKPHFEEVIYNSQKIEDEVAKSIAETSASSMPSFDVEQLIELLRDSSVPPERKVEAIAKQLPPEIKRLVDEEGGWGAAVQIKRLFQQPQLVRRVDTANWFHGEFEPNPSKIQEWCNRLLPFRKNGPAISKAGKANPHDGKASASVIKLINDASTLATLELLSRSIPEQQEKIRFLLITADGTIRQAVEEFVKSPAGRDIGDFTRHVREFSPLLNLSAIAEPNAERFKERQDIFERITAALDELLPDTHEGGFALQGTLHRRRGQISEDEVFTKVSMLRQYWSESAAVAASLALPLMKPRHGAYFNALAEALRDGAVIGDVLGRLFSIFTDVRQLHAQMTFQASIIGARKAAQAHARINQTKLRPRAPVMLIDVDFRQFTGNETDEAYFGKVARGEIPDYPSINYASDQIGFTHLFHAWLLIVVELWREAHAHSGLALYAYQRDDPSSSILDEALYCRALTYRFTMESPRDYRSGVDLLEQALTRIHGQRDPLSQARRARARSERAALRLSALQRADFTQRCLTSRSSEILFDRETPSILDDSQMQTEFQLAIGDLRAVERDWVEGYDPYVEPHLKVFSHQLKLQLYSNIAGAWILRDELSNRMILTPVGPSRAEDLMQLNQVINEDAGQYSSEDRVAILNQALLEFEEALGDVREEARQRAILIIEKAIQAMEKSGDPVNRIDLLECKFQLDRLREASAVI